MLSKLLPGGTWFRLETLILFLMEHLHCMASLVPPVILVFLCYHTVFPVGSGRG